MFKLENSKPIYLNELDKLEDLIDTYSKLCLKELTYYGSNNPAYIFELISLGQSISKIEKEIIEKYFIPMITNICENSENNSEIDSEIYYLEKIVFGFIEIIIKMSSLMINSYNNTSFEQIIIKNKFIIGFIENFIKKIIEPLIINDNLIILQCDNKIDLTNLNEFIIKNKNNFTKDKIILLDKFIQLIN